MSVATRFVGLSLISAAAVLAISSSSSAAVVVVTGGDAGQGLTLVPSDVVQAWDIDKYNHNWVIQGVQTTSVFGTGNANIVLSGADSALGDTLPDNISANDLALSDIFSTYQWKAQTVTLKGLTPNATYKVEVLASMRSGSSRVQDIALNGVAIGTAVDVKTNFFNVWGTTQADASGYISVALTPTAGSTDPNPAVSAIFVSTVVPEPATLSLLGLSTLGLLGRRSRRA